MAAARRCFGDITRTNSSSNIGVTLRLLLRGGQLIMATSSLPSSNAAAGSDVALATMFTSTFENFP